MIPYGKQQINKADIEKVIEVLKSDFLTQGPQVPLFEKKLREFCQAKFAVAVNSATSALHLACLALNVGIDDLVWTSPNSFVASSNCALYCGAKVDFIDIDPNTLNICVLSLEEKLVKAKKKGKLPKIVIPVHFAGQSCDMEKIHSLSLEFGFKIIEDASHAIGGKYKNFNVGSCKFSDITVFSFHPVKIITTGEGGAALTNSSDLYEKINILRTHGITRDKRFMENSDGGDWNYEQIKLGFNYRMSDIQAALGISQLKRIKEFLKKRHLVKKIYDDNLNELPIIKPFIDKDIYSSMHLYPIQLKLEKLSKNRIQIFKEMRDCGIGVNVHYIPIHTQPYYKKIGFKIGDFFNAENYYSRALSLPIFPNLTLNNQNRIINILFDILK